MLGEIEFGPKTLAILGEIRDAHKRIREIAEEQLQMAKEAQAAQKQILASIGKR